VESFIQPPLFELEESPLSWERLLTHEVLEALAQERGRLILMTGHRGLLMLGHFLITWRLLQQEPVVVVDGANCFDVHTIGRIARANRQDPRRLLARLQISRAFTVHQLEAVITERLESRLSQEDRPLGIISGLLDTFGDKEVPHWEAQAALKKVTEKVRDLADQGHRIVLLAPDLPVSVKARERFVSMLIKASDRVFAFSESGGTYALKDVTTERRDTRWVFPSSVLWRGRIVRR